MHTAGITTTGVAVGRDADRILLSDIAQRGGGKFYQVLSPNAIPRIFMREARRVSLPLIFEDPNGIATQVVTPGEPISGIQGALPPVTGYVLTTIKDSSLVDVLLGSPRQPQPNSAILATWQYGLGRAVALTTDAGQRWATAWPAWVDYEKMMLQTVRWSMRSHDASDKFALTTNVHDGFADVIVTALNGDDATSTDLGLSGTVVLPDGSSQNFALEQEAPGRYRGKLCADSPGNYFVAVSGLGRSSLLRSAISIPATAEFDRLTSNDGFLADIAEGVPAGGNKGQLIRAPAASPIPPACSPRTCSAPAFRMPRAATRFGRCYCYSAARYLSPMCFAAVSSPSFEWIMPFINRRVCAASFGNVAAEAERIDRLRATKSNATAQVCEYRSQLRYVDCQSFHRNRRHIDTF